MDRVSFYDANRSLIVVETGRLKLLRPPTTRSQRTTMQSQRLDLFSASISKVAPYLAISYSLHTNSGEDDNEAFNLEHMTWSVGNTMVAASR
jgi:hypothetical protein